MSTKNEPAQHLPNGPQGQQDIIHTLRTAQQHQVTLSIIADQKANIIIGFALLFFSVIQTQIFAKEFTNQVYFWPLTALSITVFVSLFFAIMVVLPRFKATKKQEALHEMPNPLFFGFFSSFTQDEYTNYMMDHIQNNETARRLMIQDMYQIGIILAKKYELLRISYLSLSAGAGLSVVVLVLKLLFH